MMSVVRLPSWSHHGPARRRCPRVSERPERRADNVPPFNGDAQIESGVADLLVRDRALLVAVGDVGVERRGRRVRDAARRHGAGHESLALGRLKDRAARLAGRVHCKGPQSTSNGQVTGAYRQGYEGKRLAAGVGRGRLGIAWAMVA